MTEQATKNQKKEKTELLVPQPRLGRKGTMGLIILMNMVAPLSTDMYLPALPNMAQRFQTTESIMNLTMVGFFFFFAVSMLFFGPISDKLGRKPLLTFGVILYGIAGLGCALSMHVAMLIGFRILQALGGGCMVSVATAIIKDVFQPEDQGNILAISQVFGGLAPMLAPIVGAWILRFFSWRATFFVLTGIACLMLVMVMLLTETLPQEKRLKAGTLGAIVRPAGILRHFTFRHFLIATALPTMAMMAYITTSSYIYVSGFGLTETAYSYFFAANALISLLGPMIYVRVRHRQPFLLMGAIFGALIFCGVGMMIFGSRSPFLFLAFLSPSMVLSNMIRPFATAILLNIHDGDAGSASALINFTNSLFGTIGMSVVASVWTNYIHGIATLLILTAAVGGLLCLRLYRKKGRDCLNLR